MAKISFYGGVGSVTGSKYLLESNGKKVLVDCGLFQGLRELRERNWAKQPFDPTEIDAVIITHAHIDHTGFLPRLVKLGFSGKVFTSRATGDLMKILLPDSARLQEEEADYRNRQNLTKHSPALPLYDEDDAKEALELLNPVPNDGNAVEVCEGFKASFKVAGHIMGASLVLVEMENARENGDSIKFLFSGDLGHYDQPILKDPAPPPACDYLMVRINLRRPSARRSKFRCEIACRNYQRSLQTKRADLDSGFCRRPHAGNSLSDPRTRRRKENSVHARRC